MTALPAALQPFLTRGVVLCTDGSPALPGAARQLGIEHHAVNLSAGSSKDGAWHVQNVNAYHSSLKGWIHQFRGVATCYLENYLGWFRAMEQEPADCQKPALWLTMALGGVD